MTEKSTNVSSATGTKPHKKSVVRRTKNRTNTFFLESICHCLSSKDAEFNSRMTRNNESKSTGCDDSNGCTSTLDDKTDKQMCDKKTDGEPLQPKAKRKTNYGIMKTNSFAIEINVSKIVITPANKRKILRVTENRLALFPTISRLNHSCQPNCNHYWCGQAGKFMIRAVR